MTMETSGGSPSLPSGRLMGRIIPLHACDKLSAMSQKPVMRVRPAIEEEGSALSAIAYAAKAHWGYPASVLAAWAPDLTISAESVARHPTFVCEVEGLLAGFYQ